MRREIDRREYEGKSNPFVPNEIVKHIHATLKEFKASEESPAVLARGNPMNPAREANESWARKPPTPHKAGRRPAKPTTVVGYYVNVEVEDHLPC
jgi:hypothetical protein